MFETPKLSYDYNALEPHIDEATMRIHHDKHHAAYTTKLNVAIDRTEFADWDIEKLLIKLNDLPENIRNIVRNNGGGHYNHNLFWEMLITPQKSGKPEGDLAKAIDRDFGNYSEFEKKISNSAVNRFGSGWVWLIARDGKLEIMSTANQDNPLSLSQNNNIKIILGLDVWEHAYYLKYQNRRPEYVENFFSVIHWEKVSHYFNS